MQSSKELTNNDTKIVLAETKKGDSFSSLALTHLNDASKEWMLREYNPIDRLLPGSIVLIPKTDYNRAGLYADGFQTIPVISYHRLTKGNAEKLVVSEPVFEAQIRFLRDSGFSPISPAQLINFLNYREQLPQKSILITFNGGWRSIYEIAYPILKKYKMKATLFIDTDFIGGKKAMSWEQLKKMADNGFAIGSLTKTHRDLTKMKKGESFDAYFNIIKEELTRSRDQILEKTGYPCSYMAYPYGKTNAFVSSLVQKLGFKGAFTLSRGSVPFYTDPYKINRSMVYGSFSLDQFRKNLAVFKRTDLK